jgi:hypothetical protein
MKGYAKYKRIKNDHLSVPIADSKTGAHIGLVKKVRLTVKLTKAENFLSIIKKEEEKFTSYQRKIYNHTNERQGGGVPRRRYNDHIDIETLSGE